MYVSKASSYFYFLTEIPIKSIDPFQFLFGVIMIDLTLRSFVDTIFSYNFLYSLSAII